MISARIVDPGWRDLNLDSFIEALADVNIGLLAFETNPGTIRLCNQRFRDYFNIEDDRQLPGLLTCILNDLTVNSRGNDDAPRRLVWEKTVLYIKLFDAGDLMWIIVQNATEREQLEAIAGAINIMDNIGHIFSGLRHEIANPLNTIKMTMSVLKRNFDATPKPKILNYIDRTLEEILRLEDLLQSLKSYGMYDNPTPLVLDVSSFIGKFLALIESDLIAKGVKIKIITRGRLFAWMDPRALQQAMLNVVTNALDALEKTRFPQIVISALHISDRIVLKVRDNGCGMTEAQIRNLFKPFVTSKSRGTGLGLVITRKNLMKLGSTIGIQSEEGQGTTVILTMPEARIDEKN